MYMHRLRASFIHPTCIPSNDMISVLFTGFRLQQVTSRAVEGSGCRGSGFRVQGWFRASGFGTVLFMLLDIWNSLGKWPGFLERWKVAGMVKG